MKRNLDIYSGVNFKDSFTLLELNFGQGGSLPIDLFPRIFQDLKVDLPSVALVCKNWKVLADDKAFRKIIRPAQAFGTQEWQEYIGVDAGEEPLLPRRAYGNLEKYDGLLTFIPEKVKVIENGKKVLLDNLEVIGKLVGNPKKGNKIGYDPKSLQEAISEKRKQEKPHWAWIKKEVIGRSKTYIQQQELVAKEETRAKISGLIDTAISVFLEYVRSGERNFVWDPPANGQRTWIRVNERTNGRRLGLGLALFGLNVDFSGDHNYGYVGIAPSLKAFLI